MNNKRINIQEIIGNPVLRKKLMVDCIIATQAREGVVTTRAQAEAAYDKVLKDNMKYGVKNLNDGSVSEDSKTDDFETARSHAISLSRWNIPCQVIDLENGEVLKDLKPYSESGAKFMRELQTR